MKQKCLPGDWCFKPGAAPIVCIVLLLVVMITSASCNENKSANVKPASGDEQAEIGEIIKMEKERIVAGITKDLSVFKAATAEDYIQIDFDGLVLNKQTTLERIKSSYAQLRSNDPEDMVVRIYGNTAVVTAKANPKGIMKGKEFSDELRYTRVYVKRDNRWQVVLFQLTRIAPGK